MRFHSRLPVEPRSTVQGSTRDSLAGLKTLGVGAARTHVTCQTMPAINQVRSKRIAEIMVVGQSRLLLCSEGVDNSQSCMPHGAESLRA